MSENRKMREEVELQLMQLSRDSACDGFEVFIARAWFVQARDLKLKTGGVGTLLKAIGVDHCAAAMISIALKGAESQTCENAVLIRMGRR
jgi:hypothetical protein